MSLYWISKYDKANNKLDNFNNSKTIVDLWHFTSDDIAKDALDGLSQSLSTEMTTVKLRSVPDIWCIPKLFEIILHSNTDDDAFVKNVKEKARTEFRSLLCIFILAKSHFGIGDRIDEVSLSVFASAQDPYTKSAFKNAPVSHIWKTTGNAANKNANADAGLTWSGGRLYTVKDKGGQATVNDPPFAISSPTTIFSPAADCWKVLHENFGNTIPWLFADSREDDYGRKLTTHGTNDPLDYLTLPAATAIYHWIGLYRSFLLDLFERQQSKDSNAKKPDPMIGPTLLDVNSCGELILFADALEERFPEVVAAPGCIDGLKIEYYLDIMPDFQMDRSDVRIADAAGKSRLLIDRKKIKTECQMMNHSPTALYALGLFTVQSVVSQESAAVNAINGAGYEIVFGDELFLEESAFVAFGPIESGNAKFEGIDPDRCVVAIGDKKYIVPMPIRECCKKLLADIETVVDDVGKVYSITGEQNGSALDFCVELSIPMHSDNPTYEKFSTYKLQHSFKGIAYTNTDDFPQSAVWPRFPLGSWKQYFVFAHNTKKSNSARPVYELIPEEIATESSTEEGGHSFKYFKLNSFPAYFELKRQRGSVGFIKLKVDIFKTSSSSGTRTYAIDFGTSSTVVHSKELGTESTSTSTQKLEFGNIKSLAIFQMIDTPANKRVIAQYFVPTELEEDSGLDFVPFQTLEHNLKLKSDTNRSDADAMNLLTLFFDARIFNKQRVYQQENPDVGYIDSDIKWKSVERSLDKKAGESGSGSGRSYFNKRTVYFENLFSFIFLDALCNNCSKIEYVVSYPEALDEDSKNRFFEDVENAATTATKECIVDKRLTVSEKITTIAESEAAARYFYHIETKIGKRLCVIDIGGGSTDILYHDKTQSSAKTLPGSIKIGARDLLVKAFRLIMQASESENVESMYLYKLLESVADDKFFGDGGTIRLEELKALADPRKDVLFNANFEELLSRRAKNRLGNETNIGDLLQEAVCIEQSNLSSDLRSILAFNIAAILYYAGLHVRYYHEKKTTIPDQKVAVCFGGNGSKMLNWLRNIKCSAEKLEKFQHDIFVSAAGNSVAANTAITSCLSDNPKQEVAMGMLQASFVSEAEKLPNVTLAGEDYTVEGSTDKKSALNGICAKDFYKPRGEEGAGVVSTGISGASIRSGNFDDFINKFNCVAETYGFKEIQFRDNVDDCSNPLEFTIGKTEFDTFRENEFDIACKNIVDLHNSGGGFAVAIPSLFIEEILILNKKLLKFLEDDAKRAGRV
jgi:hypothetical protein